MLRGIYLQPRDVHWNHLSFLLKSVNERKQALELRVLNCTLNEKRKADDNKKDKALHSVFGTNFS